MGRADGESPPSEPDTGSVVHVRPDAAEGERRQLTVLFCDLVGSTQIAARLDPEEWRDMAAQYQRIAAAAVTRFGGHVAKFLGNGLVCFFGWPQAHEEDAERAVRAGLAIVQQVSGVSSQRSGHAGGGAAPDTRPPTSDTRLCARVGIHTGPVVVERAGGAVPDVFGETPNIAARVESLAEPDTVLITAATHGLVAGRFLVDEPRATPVKGIREPVVLYRVHAPTGVRGRLAATAGRGLTPFVGREHERRLLIERWEQVRGGDGQVVLIVGEPGIGKSRLVQQFKADLGGVPHSWVDAAGSPYHVDSPLYVVREGMLKQAFAWDAEAPPEARLSILAQALEAGGLEPGEAVPLLAPLLELPLPPGLYPPILLAPEQQRRRLLAILVQWTIAFARLQPHIIVTEDLHWVDPSTLEALGLLAEQCATAPLMLISTARPEFRSPWPLRAHHMQLTLNRLTKKQVRRMIASVPARMAPPDDVVETLVVRTDGIPLFVEELTRAVVETAASHVAPGEVPATLQDSLMARLDRLGSAKEVAQIASVIGREFPYSLLRHLVAAPQVASLHDHELDAALGTLADAQLIHARGFPPNSVHTFKHALIQETAYQSLLKSRRRELHALIATALTADFAAVGNAQPELVAQHWEAAGDAERAVAAWQQAADQARQRAALGEAERYYSRALAVLGALPDSAARAQQELMLRLPLVQILGATRGYFSADMSACHTRARQLSEQLGDTRQLVTILMLAFATTFTRGETRAALAMADQLLEVAERDGSTFALTYAHYIQCLTRYMLGQLVSAREHGEQALTWYRREDHEGWPTDAGLLARGQLAYGLAQQGLAERADAEIRALLDTAQRLESPTHRVLAVHLAVAGLAYQRDAQSILKHADPVLTLAAQHGPATSVAQLRILCGWARTLLGRTDQGIAELRDGIEAYVVIQRTALGWYLGLLAEAQLAAGQVAEALTTIEQALAAVPEERVFIPELLRLRGECDSRARRATEAERCFRDSIALASEMGVTLAALRTTVSFGSLLQAEGRSAEARALLAPLYASFTEGFDTRDLIEAKALLDALP